MLQYSAQRQRRDGKRNCGNGNPNQSKGRAIKPREVKDRMVVVVGFLKHRLGQEHQDHENTISFDPSRR
jgi:hypothetical protein